jgi:hypothetical protein
MTSKRKAKTLARLGVPIFTGGARVVVDTPNGPKNQFYWWASEDCNPDPETVELHEPFDTVAEADKAAQIAVVGPDCKLNHSGQWNPAWERSQ